MIAAMKAITYLLFTALLLGMALPGAHAQFRSDNNSSLDRTGPVVRTHDTGEVASFLGLQNFRMDHSYEMTMGSFGGNMFNRNTYTNTMHLLINDNLYGRVDLAMSHSPFGSGMMGYNDQTQFYVRNAELNYKFNDNTRIQVRFQQIPQGYGYGYHPPYHRRNPVHSSYPW